MAFSAFRHAGSIIWKGRPIHLTFFLTRRCNANCQFCFYLSEEGGRTQDTSQEMSLAEIEKVSASLGSLLWLAFSGGEIFLRKDLEEIAAVFYGNNAPVHILLPTNGLLPQRVREATESIVKKCPGSTVTVKLSLDGPEELHDSMRGVEGAYKKVVETCRLLGELLPRYPNLELGVNTVLCARNQDRMEEIRALVEGLGAMRTHTVSLIRGSVADPSLKDVDAETYGRVAARMHGNHSGNLGSYRFRGARLKAAQDVVQSRSILEAMVKRKRSTPCYAGRLNVVLTENGEVFPCESFDHPMGNVREALYDLPAVLNSEVAASVLSRIRRKECWCTHECYHMTNIFFNPARYPGLAAEYLKGLA